ncbi:MAG TPA: hypothetical protein VMF89_28990, partial [Polyangiales bacterium]|nr:hypothetical protein [Polyangiales bacterium]
MTPGTQPGRCFGSWYADATPRVTLTFQDDSERYWQIKKTFSSSGNAELSHSKDGAHFSLDTKARGVEEKIRELLEWGIPAPGGKGARKGVSESFLATVLLAEQTDVDEVLAQSLKDDLSDSGRTRLRKALSTLAQSPLFKYIIDEAWREQNLYFGDKGNRRTSKTTPLAIAGKVVKEHETELAQLRRDRDQSQEIEAQVRAQQEACAKTEVELHDAEASLARARIGVANARKRADAESQLTAAKQALASVDAQVEAVAAQQKKAEALESAVGDHQQALDQAAAELARRHELRQAAEEALRSASSGSAEQARKLKAAELERGAAELGARQLQLEAQHSEVERASQALDACGKASQALEASRKELSRIAQQLTEAERALASANDEHDVARSLEAYGRWRAAEEANQRAEQTRQELSAQEQQAGVFEAEARAARERHVQRAAELSERREKLPTPARLKQLQTLHRELERAEAALGGGLSIRITPRKPLSLRAHIDRAARDVEALANELSLEAQRSALLVIDELVEIEVSAGAAERRREVAELRQRWSSEAVPVLEKAAVASLEGLESALMALAQEDAAAATLQQQAESRAADARACRDRVGLLAKQLDSQPLQDLAAKRAAIGSCSLDVLEPRWRKLGAQWETRAQDERERCEQLRAKAQTHCTELGQQKQRASYQIETGERDVRERSTQADAFTKLLAGRSASALLAQLVSDLKSLEAEQLALKQAQVALAEQGDSERVQAERALAKAKEACALAQDAHGEKQRKLDAAKAELNTALGAAREKAEQLAKLDRGSVEQRVQLCAAALQACPSDPLASEADAAAAEDAVERARRLLVEHREALHKSEGALTRVGGAQLVDRLQQSEAALQSATAKEHDLRIDAEAWRLLHQTLAAAENEESDHLGAALGRPVGEKLA